LIELGVNIDHIATLRNARSTRYPSLATAAGIVEQNGGDFITIHLREDRRHINEEDLYILIKTVETYINLEMACNEDVLKHALKAAPSKVTLVPEKREEKTTEGGLNINDQFDKVNEFTQELKKNKIKVSLFIEPDINLIEKIVPLNCGEIEIHTGHYADAPLSMQPSILKEITHFTMACKNAGLRVCAGHGLNYHNVIPICLVDGIEELNIGHSIVSQAVFSGLGNAVKEMKSLITSAKY
jgi:pyridoxine 5-phosphate synthase